MFPDWGQDRAEVYSRVFLFLYYIASLIRSPQKEVLESFTMQQTIGWLVGFGFNGPLRHVDFRYIHRDEPDGQSRSDNTTYPKIVNDTDNRSDNDNITRVYIGPSSKRGRKRKERMRVKMSKQPPPAPPPLPPAPSPLPTPMKYQLDVRLDRDTNAIRVLHS